MNAVANAVQNTLNANDTTLKGQTMGEVVNNLDKAQVKAAYKAIDAAYDIVIQKDGIEDTQRRLKGLQDKVGEKVYELLQMSVEHCEGKLVIAKAYFAA